MKSLGEILGNGTTRTTPSSGEPTTTDAARDPRTGALRRPYEEPDPGACPRCAGARFVRVTSDPHDPRFGRPEPCECVLQESDEERRARLERYSQLGPLRRLTFDTLVRRGRSNDPAAEAEYEQAVTLAERYAHRPEGWLVLTGPHGCGKTHLAAAVANAAIDRGDPVLFLTVADLLDQLRAAYQEDAELDFEARLDQVRHAPMLVLDELDAYSETAWAQEKLFQVISARFNAALPTVFTLARPFDELDARVSARLTDPALTQVVELGGDALPRYTFVGAMTRERLAAYTFAEFIPDGIGLKGEQRRSLEGAFRRASDWGASPDGWLVLLGANGCGKTHLAAAIANERLERGDRVAFANVPDLLDELRAGYAPDARRRSDQVFRQLLEAPVLILDDLGAQKSSPWAEEKLYQLLNHRHLARAFTVITTNQKPSEMERRIASRLADTEVSQMFEIQAPDFRTQGRQ